MACCLIAMMLLAQCAATLRRWGAFWGLVRVPEGVEYSTVFDRMRGWIAKPAVRMAVTAVLVAELSSVGVWIYADHRDHIAQIAEDAWARSTGHQVFYAGKCDGKGDRQPVRIVVDSSGSGS